MKKLCTVAVFAIFCLSSTLSYAQFGIDSARERTRDRVLELDTAEVPSEEVQVIDLSVSADFDQPYGHHEHQKLDIYLPDEREVVGEGSPTLIFIHGGGFTRGDKSEGEGLASYLSDKGVAVVSANYRLAPEASWPSGAEDIASLIQWAHRNSQKYSLDAGRIILMGHSAGADHVASYVFYEEHQLYDDGVVGAILFSGGSYELSLSINNEGTGLASEGDEQYFSSDVSSYDLKSALRALEGRTLPLLIGYAERDPASIQLQNFALIDALYQRDQKLPSVIQGIGEDHRSLLNHIELEAESAVAQQIVSFVNAQ